MTIDATFITSIPIPETFRKRTTLLKINYYDRIDIYNDRVIGVIKGMIGFTWYFQNYIGTQFVQASINSQFAQVVFLTGYNSNNEVDGIDLACEQNITAIEDPNRFFFSSGMNKSCRQSTNDFTYPIAAKIKAVFDEYKKNNG